MRNVAIVIPYLENFSSKLFCNGLYQNALNIYDVIKQMDDYNPYLCCICLEEKFGEIKENLNKIGYEVINFVPSYFKSKNIDVVLEVGSYSEKLLNLVRQDNPNIKAVSVELGNPYFFYAEYALFKPDKLFNSPKNRDAVWYSPHFHFCKDFISMITKTKRTQMCPFVWSNKFIDMTLNEKDLKKEDFGGVSYSNIAIVEPNLNLVKSSVIPILITNSLYKESPDLISGVSALGCKKIADAETFKTITENLSIFKDKKVFLLDRYSICDVFYNLSGLLLSHQHYNQLNYAFFDTLYLGVPLVHNSDLLKDVGYHYNKFDVTEGKERLKEAMLSHKHRSYLIKNKEKNFLLQYSVNNMENIKEYQKLLDSLF